MNNKRQQPNTGESILIYGTHAVEQALERRPDTIRTLFVASHFTNQKLLAKLRRSSIPLKPLDEKHLVREIGSAVVHQGIAARIDSRALILSYQSYIRTTAVTADSLFLLLAEIQDPQNVGAMIRSAAAFGVQAVMFPSHRQASITGTVVKVSAGMTFSVPLVEIKNTNSTISDLQQRGCVVYGLAGETGSSIHEQTFSGPSVLVVGNEGAGLREKTRAACDTLLSIPMHPRCESLNAAASVTSALSIWSGCHQTALNLERRSGTDG